MENKKNWTAPELVDLMIDDTSNSFPGTGGDGTTNNNSAYS